MLQFKKKYKNNTDCENNLNGSFLKNSIKIRSMTITAMMLALYIIFAYIGNEFFHLTFLNSFLNLDISLTFLIPLVFFCSSQYWLFAGTIGGVANLIWAGTGGWIGAVYNIVLNLVLLSFVFLLKFLFFSNIKNKQDVRTFTPTSISVRFFLICLISYIFMIFINCILNGVLFTPLYINQYFNSKTISFIEISKNPDLFKVFTLGIENYWKGIFAVYSAFNAIKFGVVFLIVYPILLTLFVKTNIVKNYFGKNIFVVVKKNQNILNIGNE